MLLVSIWVSLSKMHRQSSLIPVACPFSNFRYNKYYAMLIVFMLLCYVFMLHHNIMPIVNVFCDTLLCCQDTEPCGLLKLSLYMSRTSWASSADLYSGSLGIHHIMPLPCINGCCSGFSAANILAIGLSTTR